MIQEAKRRILIIDDEVVIREILRLLLIGEGYEVREAEDGREGLDVLTSWRPDVILLDLMMPRMNGWEFRSHQLQVEDIRKVPTVFVTAVYDATSRTESLQPAAVIIKPFELCTVLETIESILRPASSD